MRATDSWPNKIDRLVLMGFMGAGKSTVGRLLASRLDWRFVDIDQRVEEQERATIAELFERHGETGFRQIESEAIRQISRERGMVLALGGGAIETAATRALLEELTGTCLIFLDAPLGVMLERCRQQPGAAIRPILEDRERLESRFAMRLPHYRKAHLTISTSDLSPSEVVDRILKELGSALLIAATREGSND